MSPKTTLLLPPLIFLWLGVSQGKSQTVAEQKEQVTIRISLNKEDKHKLSGQDYIFTGQEDQQYDPFQQNPNQFINPSNIVPFRQSPAGFHPIGPSPGYIQSDLQTSDLPPHLQHTLPQYRFTTTPPQFQNNNPFEQINYQTAPLSSPSSFRTSQYLKPTTLRPNYSHLYSKNHGRHPSQTETFLGQITLQNPVEGPPQFDSNFKHGDEFPENGKPASGLPEESSGGNTIGSGAKPNFLNHRTRIVAPDSAKDTTKPQRSEYFINTNGEVYQPTKPTRASPIGPTKPNVKFDDFKGRKDYVPNTANAKPVDLGPLLEEPLKDNFGSNNDDEVEVIKSKHESEELTTEPFSDDDRNVTSVSGDDLTTEYEDEEEDGSHEHSNDYYADEPDRSVESSNDIRNENHEEEESDEVDNSKQQLHQKQHSHSTPSILNISSTYEVITTKPTPMVKDTNFHDFVDTAAIDSTQANHDPDPTTLPLSISMSTSVNVRRGENVTRDNGEKEEPEVVISIVTSKTVVNNTVVASVTPNPLSTESVKSSTESSVDKTDNTTDTWVVVASVQTSRSVSGARYLPSSIVEQDVRVKLLNEHPSSEESSSNITPAIPTASKNSSESEEDIDETTTDVPTTKVKTSTESLIDKLDQVQSDLSSRLSTGGLGNNIAVIKEPNPDKVELTTIDDIKLTTSSTTKAPYPQVNIRKFSPSLRKSTTKRPKGKPTRKFDTNRPQATQPDLTDLLSRGYRFNASDDKSSKLLEEILNRVKPRKLEDDKMRNEKLGEKGDRGDIVEETTEEKPETTTKDSLISSTTDSSILFKNANQVDISKFLPPGYKLPEETEKPTRLGAVKNNTKSDISKFLPPGYKLAKSEENSTESSIFKNTKADDISKFLPPGFKVPKYEKTTESSTSKNTKADDLSKFLPPGYTMSKSGEKTTEASIFKNTKADDISKFLPPGFKIPKYKESSTTERSVFKNTKADEISKFLPPGYKLAKTTTERSAEKDESKGIDVSAFLPPGYKANSTGADSPLANYVPNSTETSATTTTTPKSSTGFKVVFPSRPGGGVRKSATRTTPRSSYEEAPRNTPPTIHKGWPSRATTEFSGWPTPSTTPISIEKLLEAARAASSSTTGAPEETTTTTTTTTSTTTTTTPKPTTPGVCVDECDLYGTIRLVGGVKWVPELLDRNTKEWQLLANEVESQLDYVYSTSTLLKNWYKKIRIDGFSEGSVLVDYLVELNDVGRRVDTQEMKKLFHESLDDALLTFGGLNREGKALNEIMKLEGKLSLGNFLVDPAFTDFLVLPKQQYPTVGMANDDVLLPQWAIAVIVIGLASLLFVIIFGVTVLVNRQKNAKKKSPTPLTEDMLNELNKNHMGGLDNYGADDLYNMEDVWNDRGYEQKPHKKRSNGSLNDNSMSNLYDSWRSEWNGYYYNAYYGNNPGSSHSGYNGRRRSDYDTNF